MVFWLRWSELEHQFDWYDPQQWLQWVIHPLCKMEHRQAMHIHYRDHRSGSVVQREWPPGQCCKCRIGINELADN